MWVRISVIPIGALRFSFFFLCRWTCRGLFATAGGPQRHASARASVFPAGVPDDLIPTGKLKTYYHLLMDSFKITNTVKGAYYIIISDNTEIHDWVNKARNFCK